MDAKKAKGNFIFYLILTLFCIGFLAYFTIHDDIRGFTFLVLSVGNTAHCIKYLIRYKKATKKQD